MYKITAEIEGVAPILFNRPTNMRESHASKSDKALQEAAKLKVHRNTKNEIIWPGYNLKLSIIQGAKMAGIKFQRNQGLAKYLNATMFIEDSSFGRKDYDNLVLSFPKAAGGSRPAVYRPCIEKWKLPIVISIMDDRIKPDDVRRSVDEAGLLVGAGSWRPDYGRFMVTKWKVG